MTVTRKQGASSSKLRKQARKLTVGDLYGGGVSGNLLQGRYGTEKIYAWFQNRHRRDYKSSIDENGYYHSDEETAFGDGHAWKVPATIQACLKENITRGQVNIREPWYVTWISPKTGKRLQKKFGSPMVAIHFIATKAQYVDPHAAIVSRTRAYDVPAKWRGKFPHKQPHGNKTRTWYWCPLCMQPRRFFAARPLQHFYAMTKRWDEEKGRFVYRDRKLALLQCKHCGCTNRDSVFRRSNQPWETRRFKTRVRRAKRRT